MNNSDLRSPAAEASNLRRQIRDLQERVRESRRVGNGPRTEHIKNGRRWQYLP